jgi:hypothetical protein
MLTQWWRLDDYDRARIWKHYGLFCGLMCFGSCTGAVSYVTVGLYLDNFYKSFTDGDYNYSPYSQVRFVLQLLYNTQCSRLHSMARCQSYVTLFQSLRWFVVYLLAYPFTFCCLVTAKLLVLGRLRDFSQLRAHASSRWSLCGRVLVCAIVVSNVIALFCNIAASVLFLKVADFYEQLAFKNVDNVTTTVFNETGTDFHKGTQLSGVFFGFEAIMLPLIVIAFLAAGAASVRRIRAAMTVVKTAQLTTMLDDRATNVVGFGGARRTSDLSKASLITGHRLKRQIVGTCGILFVSFSIRAVLSLMLTTGALFGKSGTTARCDEKNNVVGLMLVWILYTPELVFFVTLLCQPVTLLVTLWGMTSGQTIAVMRMRANSLDPNS